jgi:hypothetical protein
VVRWLSASLMLLLCLLLAGSGVIQPTVLSVSGSDPPPDWFGVAAYGVIHGAIPPSALDVADASPAVAVPAEYLQLVLRPARAAHAPAIGPRTDQSLTYLRTARLRL